MMPKIFVSYSRSDSQFTEQFVVFLRQTYKEDVVWYDQNIIGGVDWWKTILENIANCDLFVYLLSNDSLESPYCQAEFREALRLNKQFLPLLIKSRPDLRKAPDDIERKLRGTQWINISQLFTNQFAIVSQPTTNSIEQLLVQAQREAPRPLSNTPTAEPLVADLSIWGKIRNFKWKRVSIGCGTFILIPLFMTVVGGLVQTWPDIVELFSSSDTLTSQAVGSAPTDSLTVKLEPDTPILPSPTTDTLQQALQRASSRMNSNAEWENLYPNGFMQNVDGYDMLVVPTGCFTIGSNDGQEDQLNGNNVCFEEPFWIDKYEVTNQQYGSTGCEGWSSEPDQPYNCVTWFEATAFCERRNARLPSEAEWEYAARGPDELVYPWGDTYLAENVIGLDDEIYGNISTAPVGRRLAGASWVGAMDMSGNVWEWTNSLYENYPYNKNDGREADTGDSADVDRVLRGGSISNTSNFLRSAVRNRFAPNVNGYDVGFRCVRSLNR